ncbi:hypothetical protein SK271_0720 [Streptococcus mitis]|uniref:Uncharacterized protein n=1 Tax=Streptococcus mitis TaxID=28037 RepID=A0A081SCM2_STRMT|nr:hypothetical protein SK271_0720 [Streptococcus mitis]
MSSTKGKTLYFNNKSMDYVIFGQVKKSFVIIKRVLVFLES